MRTYPFRIVNVFTESTFGGNPLAVIEDARGLSDDEMLALTDQFNLSETSFILPSSSCAARVRIWSPGYEMPFAGHPTLGTAFVVSELLSAGPRFSLELKVGPISVEGEKTRWRLKAAAPSYRECDTPRQTLARMLGLDEAAVLDGTRWVSCGSEHLLVPLESVNAVRACEPDLSLLREHARSDGRVHVYIFARTASGFTSRFFWEQHGLLREDAGTGSACANLGAWWLASNGTLPLESTIEQGHAVGRLNVLSLRVDEDKSIYVGGNIVPLMRGVISLPV
jgi:PhzF family phenazine biosynthesis protein